MKKSTITIVLVFMVLLVAVVLSLQKKPERGITRVTLASTDTAAIDRISISGKNPVELKREGERWLVSDGREAEPNGVKRLLEAIPKINSSDLVTKDANRFADYEVDEQKGTKVIAYAGGSVVTEFVVGKAAAGGANVRIGDGVYQVKQLFPYVFSRESPGWYNLKLFDTKLEDVTRVDVTPSQGKPFGLAAKEDKWELVDPKVAPEGFRFDANGARTLVSSLINLRAQNIVQENPGPEKTGLEKGYDVLTFVDKSGQNHEVHLGALNDKEEAYAQVVGRSEVFLISKYTHQGLRKQIVDLRDLRVIDLQVDKVSKLTIADGKQSLVLEKKEGTWAVAKSSEKSPADFEFDPQMVQRRLSAMANARAFKLSDEKALGTTGLAKPEATLVATLDDGKIATLAFGKTTKRFDREVSFARGNIDDEIYLLDKVSRSNLTGMLTTFKKQPTPPPGGMPDLDPQALSKLPPDVRAGLMKQMQEKKQQQEMLKKIQEQMQNQKTP